MTGLATFRSLAKGARSAPALLHTCRFEGLGSEAYGTEAIVERLGKAPFDLSADAAVIETPRNIAVFDGERAIFADLVDGNVARIWLLGPDQSGDTEPILAVPFDPDLAQAGTDVLFAPADHPDLANDALEEVESRGREIVATADGQRTRAFVIRAFGKASAGAALYAVFRLRPGQKEVAGFTLMAVRWSAGAGEVVRDFGGEAALAASRWAPRIGA